MFVRYVLNFVLTEADSVQFQPYTADRMIIEPRFLYKTVQTTTRPSSFSNSVCFT